MAVRARPTRNDLRKARQKVLAARNEYGRGSEEERIAQRRYNDVRADYYGSNAPSATKATVSQNKVGVKKKPAKSSSTSPARETPVFTAEPPAGTEQKGPAATTSTPKKKTTTVRKGHRLQSNVRQAQTGTSNLTPTYSAVQRTESPFERETKATGKAIGEALTPSFPQQTPEAAFFTAKDVRDLRRTAKTDPQQAAEDYAKIAARVPEKTWKDAGLVIADIVPGVYVSRNWSNLTPEQRAGAIIIDVAVLAPFVPSSGRVTFSGGRAVVRDAAGRAVKVPEQVKTLVKDEHGYFIPDSSKLKGGKVDELAAGDKLLREALDSADKPGERVAGASPSQRFGRAAEETAKAREQAAKKKAALDKEAKAREQRASEKAKKQAAEKEAKATAAPEKSKAPARVKPSTDTTTKPKPGAPEPSGKPGNAPKEGSTTRPKRSTEPLIDIRYKTKPTPTNETKPRPKPTPSSQLGERPKPDQEPAPEDQTVTLPIARSMTTTSTTDTTEHRATQPTGTRREEQRTQTRGRIRFRRSFRLPTKVKPPPGQYARVVQWKDGPFENRADLVSGVKHSKLVGGVGKPRETFQVLSYSVVRPRTRVYDFGRTDLVVDENGVRFMADRSAQPRPAQTFHVRGFRAR